MSSVLIYVLGVLSGLAIAFAVVVAMIKAAKMEREKARKENARPHDEKDIAYDRGYNRAIADQRRLTSRSAAEQFADTFEGRRVQFRSGEIAK